MRTGRNNKNGGFSLVELIIVVAIMAIVVGVMGLSVGTLTGRKTAKCADEIVSTLERARVLTLGKEQNQVEFVLTDVSGEYHAQIYQGGTKVSDRIVGKDPITIQVYFANDNKAYSLSELKGTLPYATATGGLHLVFNRASGAFEEKTCAANDVVKDYCDKIVISDKNGTRKITVTTVGRTGKILKK